jgi:integrase
MSDPDLEARLGWIVAQLGPRTPLHAISDDMVSKLVEARRLDVRPAGRDGDGKQLYRPITARTVNKTTVSLLRRVLRRARDNWDAALLREPTWKKHLLKETKFRIRELMPSEESKLDAVEDSDFADVRRFAIITGLRRGNVLLKKSQVNFEAGTIAIISKGGVPRVLPLSAEAYAILWRRQNHPTEYVFTFLAQRTRKCPKTGRKLIKGERYPISYYGLGSNKRKWAAAGVDARIHDLRHTTGMRTLRATGNLKVVQKLLGHSDIAITARFYTDATLEDLRGAMETTARAIEIIKPQPTIEHKKQDGEQ